MSIHPWLRWAKLNGKASKRSICRPPASIRLQLEQLETRLTPATNPLPGGTQLLGATLAPADSSTAVAITTTSLSDWTQNNPGYNQFIHTTGGTAPVTFNIESGSLPPGLALNRATGTISGIPSTQGSYSFTI